jgi:LPS-assembly lipoprotein
MHNGKRLASLESDQAWSDWLSPQRGWRTEWQTVSLLALLLVTLVQLSGCGFHLRGYATAGEAQFKSIKIDGLEQVQADVAEALTRQLNSSQVEVVRTLGQAELALRLSPTHSGRTRTAYTGSGDVSSVLLTIKQPFEVVEVASETQLLNTEAIAYRDQQIDTGALLASNRELRDIQQQMGEEIARQIVDRINRALLQRDEAGEASLRLLPATQGGDPQ